MPPPSRPTPGAARALFAVTAVVAGALALSGCTTTPSTTTKATGGTPTPSATAHGTALSSTPFTIDCDTLEPAAVVAAAFPGMALTAPTKKPVGDAAVVKAAHGQLCTWSDAAGDTMTIAVGRFAADSLTLVKNGLVTTSNSVPTYGVEGYFTTDGSVGVADAFRDPYWIVGTSTLFVEPGSVQPLMAQAVTAVTAAGAGS